MNFYTIKKSEWDYQLESLLSNFNIYATIQNEFGLDYELVETSNIPYIIYNTPKPTTPLKSFFLPIKENVASNQLKDKQRVIIGISNCDLEGLDLLDEIYLDKDFIDPFYREKREQTILITTDCFSVQEHCHCTSNGINPFNESKGDISLVLANGMIILKVFSAKGETFIQNINYVQSILDLDTSTKSFIKVKRAEVVNLLSEMNEALPDYKTTGLLLGKAKDDVWKRYSSTCVSCGACSTICPTCSCFLLIDKPNFEKVRQIDTCQYPGFERIAGGEDALHRLSSRFRNRYKCKYVWKPEKFKSIACTGCGRCIEACIGKINKNELFIELAK